MDKSFEEFIEKKTACDAEKLDRAIMRGIQRAKFHKLDKRRIVKLGAAYAASLLLVIGFSSNENIIKTLRNYFIETSVVNEANSIAMQNYLQSYLNMIKEELL